MTAPDVDPLVRAVAARPIARGSIIVILDGVAAPWRRDLEGMVCLALHDAAPGQEIRGRFRALTVNGQRDDRVFVNPPKRRRGPATVRQPPPPPPRRVIDLAEVRRRRAAGETWPTIAAYFRCTSKTLIRRLKEAA